MRPEGKGAEQKCVLYEQLYCRGDLRSWSETEGENKLKCEKCPRKQIGPG